MKYRLLLLVSCLAHAHLKKPSYTIHLEIENSTPDNIYFEYQTEPNYRRQPVVCKAGSTCTVKWHRMQPFKINFSRIRCGKHYCNYMSKPLKFITIHSSPQNNRYQMKKIRVSQSWPFKGNVITEEGI